MAAALDLRDWDRVDEMMEGLKAQVCR
jgi:hypothetical protein